MAFRMREKAMSLKQKMSRWHSRTKRRQSLIVFLITVFSVCIVASLVFSQANRPQESPSKLKRHILPLRVEERTDGTHVSIVSDAPLTDYSSSRSGDRYYVVIPQADASSLHTVRGRNFEGVQAQQRGGDVVLMFHIPPGASARINQRFNRLDVVINSSLGAIVTQTPARDKSASANANSRSTNADKNQTPNKTEIGNTASRLTVSPPNASQSNGATETTKDRTKSATQNPSVALPTINSPNPLVNSTPQTANSSPAPSASPASPDATIANNSDELTIPQSATPMPAQTVPVAATSNGIGSFVQRNWLWLLIALFLLAVIALLLFWRNLFASGARVDGRNQRNQRRKSKNNWQPRMNEKTSGSVKASGNNRSVSVEQKRTNAPASSSVAANSPLADKHESAMSPKENIFWQPNVFAAAQPLNPEMPPQTPAEPEAAHRLNENQSSENHSVESGTDVFSAAVSPIILENAPPSGDPFAAHEAKISSVAMNETPPAAHSDDEFDFTAFLTPDAPATAMTFAPETEALTESPADMEIAEDEPRIPIIAVPHIIVTRGDFSSRKKPREIEWAEWHANDAQAWDLNDRSPDSFEQTPSHEDVQSWELNKTENGAYVLFEDAPREETQQHNETNFTEDFPALHIGDATEFDDAQVITSSPIHPVTTSNATHAPTESHAQIEVPVPIQDRASAELETSVALSAFEILSNGVKPPAVPSVEAAQPVETITPIEATTSLTAPQPTETAQAAEAASDPFAFAEPIGFEVLKREHRLRQRETTPADIAPTSVQPNSPVSSPSIISPASTPSVSALPVASVTNGFTANHVADASDAASVPNTGQYQPSEEQTVSAGSDVKGLALREERAIEAHSNANADAVKEIQPHESFSNSTTPTQMNNDSAQATYAPNNAAARAAYVAQLASLQTDEALKEICAAFDDTAVEVRVAAARALNRLNADRTDSFTRALREATPERRRKIGAAIAESGLADEAIRRLHGVGREETYDAFSLLFLMAKAGELAPLVTAVETHHEREARLSVIKLLALSGQQDALPALRRLAVRSSLPVDIRSAVMEAIFQIGASHVAMGASHVA